MQYLAKLYIPILLLLVLVKPCCARSFSFNQGGASKTSYYISLPYETVYGKMVVKAEVGGKIRRFIFDTGAPTSLSHELVEELGLQPIKKVRTTDQGGHVRYLNTVSVPAITVGGVTFTHIPALEFWHSMLFITHKVDGFIGSNLLRNSVVQFVPSSSTIVITDQPARLGLSKDYSTKLYLDVNGQSTPAIWIRLGSTRAQFIFDTGSEELLSLHDDQYHKLKGNEQWAIVGSTEKNQSHGVFGSSTHAAHHLLVPKVRIGKVELLNVYMSTTNGIHSRIGQQLFKYGRVTVDYRNKKFYLEPL